MVVGLFAQKGHGPVKVMKLDVFCSIDGVVPAPLVAEAVRTADHQPVQDGQEKRPLNVEEEKSFRNEPLDDLGDSQLFPQPLENESGGRP